MSAAAPQLAATLADVGDGEAGAAEEALVADEEEVRGARPVL